MGVFNEDNRYLLWCDQSGCATGMSSRWGKLLKETIFLERLSWRGEGKHSKGCKILWVRDFESKAFRKYSLGGFRLSKLLLGLCVSDKDMRSWLYQIKEATRVQL